MREVVRAFFLTFYVMASGSAALPLPKGTFVPGQTSANVASTKGAQLKSSSGLSWPDGRQVIISFWQLGSLQLRCRTFFDIDMRETGDICERPQEGAQ